MTELLRKRCVVTGAAQGMGRLFAERLLDAGADVALLDINAEVLKATAAQLAGRGRVTAHVVDLADAESVYEAAEAAVESLGGVDLLINNAGIVTGGALTEVSDAQHELTINVNVLGVVRMTRALLPHMQGQGSGHIVNMASASGLTGLALGTTYSASKFAVVGFSDSLHCEMRQLRLPIVVTCVCPGYIDTGMFEGVKSPMLSPILKPSAVADRVMEAIQRDERLVLMPEIVRHVPWMRAILPDRVLDFLNHRLGVNRSMARWQGH